MFVHPLIKVSTESTHIVIIHALHWQMLQISVDEVILIVPTCH